MRVGLNVHMERAGCGEENGAAEGAQGGRAGGRAMVMVKALSRVCGTRGAGKYEKKVASSLSGTWHESARERCRE